MKEKTVFGILAHVDAGKTTLSESLLYNTGVIKAAGRVDSGNSFLDDNALERERGITIYTKNARIPLNDKEIILIDTPGHVDFSTETERAISVLDAAILIVDASTKVSSHTKTLWGLLKYYDIPVYIFVNKTDMPGYDKESVMDSLKTLSSSVVDFTDDSSNQFFENIAFAGEKYLNEFLENSRIEIDLIKEGIKRRELFPVFFGSALKNIGITEFIEGLGKYMIKPETFGRENDELSAKVYKIGFDDQGKRLSYMKITSGTLRIKDMLGDEKVNEIRVYSGNKFTRETEVFPGEICAIVGLENSTNGQVYGAKEEARKTVLSPVLNYAISFPKEIDIKKMWDAVSKLTQEDPSLNAEYDESLKEIRMSLMGEVQTQIIKRKLKDEYGYDVTFNEGKIRYKETISDTVIGVGHFEPLRHYAEVQIKMEPLERGEGLKFESELSEDYLDINWQKLVLTHLKEREHRGVLTGSPITDIKFTLVAGRAHIKHTEGGDFRQAVYRAVRQGLMKALETESCVLLEPYYDYTIEAPTNYAGRIVTDINALDGSAVITENDAENGTSLIVGKVSVSALNSYTSELVALSKGKAVINFEVSGYDVCHNSEEVIEKRGYNPDSDSRNPSSSVFCSHGSGTIIEWFDVDKYKHTFYSEKYGAMSDDMDDEAKRANRLRRERELKEEEFISVEEVDSIIRSSSYANENGRKGAYKGVSEAMRNRVTTKTESKDVSYIGTVKKDKYLLADGYNIIHAWNELSELAVASMGAAVSRLNEILSNYGAMTGENVIVVYDAYKVEGHRTEEIADGNITVVYTKEAQTADEYIERYAHQNSKKYDITVATSDGVEQIIVAGKGCNIISSQKFEEEIKRISADFNLRFGVGD